MREEKVAAEEKEEEKESVRPFPCAQFRAPARASG